jgi:hypothetical protein
MKGVICSEEEMRKHNYKGWWVITDLGVEEIRIYGPLTKGEGEKVFKEENKQSNNTWLLRGQAVLQEEARYIDKHLMGYMN